MTAEIRIFSLASLLFCTYGLLFAQNANDYRAKANGNWSDLSTWERYSGTAWEAATTIPDSNVGLITIDSGYTVTIASDIAVDSVTVHGGGHVVINSGVVVTVGFNNDGRGFDVDTLGTITVNGTIRCLGRVSGARQSVIINNGGVYEHARNGGSLPFAKWNEGSTILLTGVTANSPNNFNQDFYNITIHNTAQTSNLDMRMTGNTISGNITVLSTNTARYYLTNTSSSNPAYASPITILGDIIIQGGTFSVIGSGQKGPVDPVVVHHYGNVKVTGGNFGCSRGSAPSVSFYLHGDSIVVLNATLQNSTSSPLAIQKFIFAKQGTQYLQFANVSYGGSGTSPITYQVSSGTTLDIDTSYLQGPLPPSATGSTGSFILDSGATLISRHAGKLTDGSIECTADFGGGNSFLNIQATEGSGRTIVKSFKGAHPNAHDPSKSLQRYYSVDADAGITKATMTFYYFDTPIAPVSEVMGTETNYKALHYAGHGNNWLTLPSSDDDLFDFVLAEDVLSIGGIWTAGEPTPAVTGSACVVSKPSLNFGSVTINSQKTDSIRVSNLGSEALQISQISSSNPKFSASSLASVASLGNENLVITFMPTAIGNEAGEITISHNAPNAQTVITVEGKGEQSTSVEMNNQKIPSRYSLGNNYPNPFNPSTTITYGLPKEEFVTIKVYNLIGQEVATVFEGKKNAGSHSVSFNAYGLNSGVYFYKIQAGNFSQVKRMVLVK